MTCTRHRALVGLFFFLSLGIVSAGCGGGQGSAPAQSQTVLPSAPLSVLTWNPPANYADNAAMDPFRDLDHYEVFVRGDGNFTETDLPVAVIAAVKDAPSTTGLPANRVLESEFLLDNIRPFIVAGNRHYVSLKAVGTDGQKSGFMSPVAWDTI